MSYSNKSLLYVFVGECDVTKCSAIIYRDCPDAASCGSRNGYDCKYIAGGIQNSGCGWNPCSSIVGNGNWQNVCGGADAIDIIGPCSAKLAQGSNGHSRYKKVLRPGFHGIWMVYEDGRHFGDAINSINLTC